MFVWIQQGMDRGVFGEKRAGHDVEPLAHDRRQVADGHRGPAAVRRVSAGRRPISDRIALHIHSPGVCVELGFGLVVPDFRRTVYSFEFNFFFFFFFFKRKTRKIIRR